MAGKSKKDDGVDEGGLPNFGNFVCNRPCWHGLKTYNIGDRATFIRGEWPQDKAGKLRHFTPVDKATEALVADYELDPDMVPGSKDGKPVVPKPVAKDGK